MPFNTEFMDRNSDYFLDFYTRNLAEVLEPHSNNCPQSPIEEMLLAALVVSFAGSVIEFKSKGSDYFFRADRYYASFFSKIIPQFQVYENKKVKYRIDIALFSTGGLKMAIECDGHDYHEKTKEQAKHDKERDRWLQQNGWFVARFTGSEIFKDTEEVVFKIGEIVFKWESERLANKNK